MISQRQLGLSAWTDASNAIVDLTPLRTVRALAHDSITSLQQAQETPWKSVAADVFREQLFTAIGLVRSIESRVDDSIDAVTRVNSLLTQQSLTPEAATP